MIVTFRAGRRRPPGQERVLLLHATPQHGAAPVQQRCSWCSRTGGRIGTWHSGFQALLLVGTPGAACLRPLQAGVHQACSTLIPDALFVVAPRKLGHRLLTVLRKNSEAAATSRRGAQARGWHAMPAKGWVRYGRALRCAARQEGSPLAGAAGAELLSNDGCTYVLSATLSTSRVVCTKGGRAGAAAGAGGRENKQAHVPPWGAAAWRRWRRGRRGVCTAAPSMRGCTSRHGHTASQTSIRVSGHVQPGCRKERGTTQQHYT